jgi:WD40 repeat protein
MRWVVTAILLVLTVHGGAWPAAAEFLTARTLGAAGDKGSGHVRAVAFSPNGRSLAVAGDGAIRLWDVASGSVLHTLSGDPQSVQSVAFSPDGHILASGGLDGLVKVWDVASGRQLYSFANRAVAYEVTFSPDGRTLASTTDTNPFAFAPDGRTAVAAIASSPSLVRLWDVSSGREAGLLQSNAPPGAIDYRTCLRVWDVVNRRELRMLPQYIERAVAFSPDSHLLVIGGQPDPANTGSGCKIQLLDLAAGRVIKVLASTVGICTSVAYSPDGRLVAAASFENEIKLWDAASGRELPSLVGHLSNVSAIAFSPVGRVLASGSLDGTTNIWPLSDISSPSSNSVASPRMAAGDIGRFDGSYYSPEFKYGFRIQNGGGTATISNSSTYKPGDPILRFKVSDANGFVGEQICTNGKFYPVTGVLAPDGNLEMSISGCGAGGTIQWRMVRSASVPSAAPGGATFAPAAALSVSHADTVAQAEAPTDPAHAGEAKVFVLAGHADNMVEAIAFSADGQWLVSGGGDREVILWDAKRRQEIRRFKGAAGSVQAVAISPDGSLIASGGQDMIVRLWDARAGTEIREFKGHTGAVTSLAFLPDGKTLVSGAATSWGQGVDKGEDNTTRTWEVATGREIRRLTEYDDEDDLVLLSDPRDPTRSIGSRILHKALRKPGGGVMTVAISPNGRLIATGTAHDTVRIWDATGGAVLRELAAPFKCGGIAWSVAFSPDGSRLVSACGPLLRIWDVAGGREVRRLQGHTGDIRSVAFSPDGTMVGSAGEDGTIRLWDAAGGRELHRLEGPKKTEMALAFSPDGRTVAAGGFAGIRIWEPDEAKVSKPAESPTVSNELLVYAHDGTRIATATGDNRIWVWDMGSGRLLNRLAGHTNHISAMSFSPNGEQLASVGWDGTLRLWDIANGRETHRFEIAGEKFGSVAFSPDGHTVAFGIADRLTPAEAFHINELNAELMLSNMYSKAPTHPPGTDPPLRSPEKIKRDIQSLLARRNGLRFDIRLIDAETGNPTATLEGHEFTIFDLAFAADGRSLLSVSGDRTARLWDLGTYAERRSFRFDSYPWHSAVSPDGASLLIDVLQNRTVSLWDVTSGNHIASIDTRDQSQKSRPASGAPYQNFDSIASLAISPDDKRLLLGNHDGTIRVWDLASNQEVLRAKANSSWVNSVAFSHDGARIAATGTDGSIRIFNATNLELIGTLYGFADGEWISILPDGRYAASPLGGSELRVLLGNDSTQTRPVEQYSTQFYKPDFVAGALAREAAARPASADLGTGHTATPAEKPRLYYLGVGVSHYQHLNQDDNLQFAATDAIDLGTALKAQEGKAFEKVKTKTLTEAQVTRSKVFAEAGEFLRQARDQDVIILFLAGHGINTDQSGYYFLTYDVDPARRAQTAISWTAFDSLLRDVRAPVIFLTDTCKSADVVGSAAWLAQSSVEAEHLARGMTRNGVLVMTSSDAQSVSWEDARFHDEAMTGGHGAFAWALIEGIRGAAADKNGAVTLTDLWRYVLERVPRLTEPLAAHANSPLPPQTPEIARSEATTRLMSLEIAK